MAGRTSIEKLRSLLAYDPETGILTWRPRRSKGVCFKGGEIAGTIIFTGYRAINIDRMPQLAHRIAWAIVTGQWPKHQIDHINMDRLDNRWCNLREATNSQNSMNRGAQSNNKTGLKGVTTHSSPGWFMARIHVDGKTKYLGIFRTKEEAKSVYDAEAVLLHKNFCRNTAVSKRYQKWTSSSAAAGKPEPNFPKSPKAS